MPKAIPSQILLLLLFAFAFGYRLLLMLWAGYPPGADIGLHNSVIHSIIGTGNVDFLYNFFHIGGGVSLTFPGYHIFTAAVMLMTGMPEYLAQAGVVSLFSALIVLCAYLITKKVWSTAAAVIVAFLVAISRFDIEMLMWAGYPNILALMLIPLTFYLFLEKDRFSKVPFFVSTSILVASLFLTHSLSAVMFVGMLAPVVLFILLWPKTLGATRKSLLYWILPLVFGALLIAPFLIEAVPTYLNEYGSAEITNATLASRVLPYWIVLPLFLIIVGIFAFSVKYYRKFLTLPTFLVAMWVFVPLICTQGYLIGAPVDYNRFLYFLILPVLVFIGILIVHGSETFALAIDKNRASINFGAYKIKIDKRFEGLQHKLENAAKKLAVAATRKRLYSFFVLFFLLFSFVALPIFATPSLNVGETLQSFYQTMDNPKWEATQWLKQNTSEGSVLVADALYGWWLGGFANRPTLSAVDPAYLTVNREVDNATFARNLLDTDYIIDNNSTGNNTIPQVRDDGGYIARHNPEILVRQNWTYYPSSFFNFNSTGTTIAYHVGTEDVQSVQLNQLPLIETKMVNDSAHATIIVTRGNENFTYSVSTTVTAGIRFVNVTQTLTSLRSGVHFDLLDINVGIKPVKIDYDSNVTMGFVDMATKAFGQLIFNTSPMKTEIKNSEVTLLYTLHGKDTGQIQILATAYSESNQEKYYSSQAAMDSYFSPIMTKNLESALQPIDGKNTISLDVFDYHAELQSRHVSYVVLSISRDSNPDKTELDVLSKFLYDPLFNLVFINEEVAIFQVNGNLQGVR